VLNFDCAKFRPPKGPGEPQQQEGAVAQTEQIVATGGDKLLDFLRCQRLSPLGRTAMSAPDPSQHVADGRVARIERVAGEPTSARYRCHFPAQCRPGVSLAKVGQVVSHQVWRSWYGN
jgi:hypothetical protein